MDPAVDARSIIEVFRIVVHRDDTAERVGYAQRRQ
jgi:hypothetical protein